MATVPVRFTLVRELKYGQVHKLVGDHPALGSWDIGSAPEMAWGEGHTWSAEIRLPPGTSVEFKCVRVKSNGGSEHWEQGANRTLTVPSDTDAVEVALDWEGARAAPDAGASDSEQAWSSSGSFSSSTFSDEETLLGNSQWSGKEVVFMSSNEHSKERSGRWEVQGLEGPAKLLVEGDRENGRCGLSVGGWWNV